MKDFLMRRKFFLVKKYFFFLDTRYFLGQKIYYLFIHYFLWAEEKYSCNEKSCGKKKNVLSLFQKNNKKN